MQKLLQESGAKGRAVGERQARAVFDEAGRTWDGLLQHLLTDSPHLRRRLSGAEQLTERPLTAVS